MRVLCGLAVAVWLGLIAAGFGWLAAYETRPGASGGTEERWPKASSLQPEPQRWNLVLFLHPQCPCSSASLQELNELVERHSIAVRARVLLCKPAGVPEGWEKTALWKQATSIGGVEVVTDESDAERRHFGALTSGQLYVYDPDGKLRYSGGITPARGRNGANDGRRTVEALLDGQRPPLREGPVFGCPLVAEAARS